MTLALRVLLSLPFWLLRLAILLFFAVLGLPIIFVLAWRAWCWPAPSISKDQMVLLTAGDVVTIVGTITGTTPVFGDSTWKSYLSVEKLD